MNVYVIGVGLIGGSMALDIKSNYENVTVFGIDSNEKYLDIALKLKIIDNKALISDLADADFVITGTVYPHENKPEGPFGDHLGYYSLTHLFPLMILSVY